MIAENLASQLRAVPLFKDLSTKSLEALAGASHTRHVARGKILFQQDDPANAVFVVQSGAIALLLSTPDGRELVINEMHSGDYFGELALLTGGRRSTGAVATKDSKIIWIPRHRFLKELEEDAGVMRHVLKTTAERLQISSQREGALAFLDAPSRLAKTLLQLEARMGENGVISISQEELGQRVGLARQTVAKTLGRWRRAGWVLTKRGRIEILDRSALRDQVKNL